MQLCFSKKITENIQASPRQWPATYKYSILVVLIAYQQSLGQKIADFRRYWQILVKKPRRFIVGDLKAFFSFFCFDFLHIDPINDFCCGKFFAKGLKSEGKRL
jgi:hypothetical protein